MRNHFLSFTQYLAVSLVKNVVLLTLKFCFKGTTRRNVWTSGSNEGDFCDVKRSFAWCSTGSKINDSVLNNTEYWANNLIPGENLTPKKCLSLDFNSSLGNVGLVQSECEELRSLLCLVFTNKKMESFCVNLRTKTFSPLALQLAAQLSALKMYVKPLQTLESIY
jgi:hypothetical protein